MKTSGTDCFIVGGGLSGLIAGTVLQRAGLTVAIADKGRGIGGRLATRRINQGGAGEGIFDYGAQYFRAMEPTFERWVEQWLAAGVITTWPALELQKHSDHPIYRGTLSNRHLAKHLAQGLTVHRSTNIDHIRWHQHQWHLTSQGGQTFSADKLLLTAPAPQSLELLHRSAIVPTDLAELEKINYHRCLALLVRLNQPATISPSGGLGPDDDSIVWIGANDQKGISPDCPAVTIHGSPDFTTQYWQQREAGAKKLLQRAHHLNWFPPTAIVDYQIHGWGYSIPKTTYPKAFYQEPDPKLGALWLAGDGFNSSESCCPIEGAFVSGLAVAEAMVNFQG